MNKFTEAAEGLGDILVYNVKTRTKNEEILKVLDVLYKALTSLADLKQTNLNKYEAKFSQENVDGFQTLTDQIIRVINAAMEAENGLIAIRALWSMHDTLKILSEQEKNESLIGDVLAKIRSASHKLMQQGKIESIGKESFGRWYYDAMLENSEKIKPSYFNIFNKALLDDLKVVINEGNFSVIESFVAHFVDHGYIFPHEKNKIWDIDELIIQKIGIKNLPSSEENVFHITQKISESLESLYSENDLKKVEDQIETLENMVKPSFLDDPSILEQKLNEVRKIIKMYYQVIQFRGVIFDAMVFSIKKNKYEIIDCFSDYNQPSTSHACWASSNIFFESIEETVRYSFTRSETNFRFGGFEGHDSPEVYEDRLILRFFSKIKLKENKSLQEISSNQEINNIKSFFQFKIGSLNTWSTNNLAQVGSRIDRLKKEWAHIPNELRFGVHDKDMHEYLETISNESASIIEQRLLKKPISPSKVAEFIDRFLIGYDKAAAIKNIFRLENIIEYRVDEATTSEQVPQFIVHYVNNKAAFLDDWFVRVIGFGKDQGLRFSADKEKFVFEKILEQCVETTLEDAIIYLNDNASSQKIIGLGASPAVYPLLTNSLTQNLIVPDNNNYDKFGYLKIKNSKVELFTILGPGEYILFFDINNLGKMVEYKPSTRDMAKPIIKNTLAFSIDSFAENSDLVKKYMDNPPDWLSKISENERIKHLHGLIEVMVREQFVFTIDPNFSGKKVKMKDTF